MRLLRGAPPVTMVPARVWLREILPTWVPAERVPVVQRRIWSKVRAMIC